MEGKTNFSRHLKQSDGLTWLTLTPYFTRDLRHCPRGLLLKPLSTVTKRTNSIDGHWKLALRKSDNNVDDDDNVG